MENLTRIASFEVNHDYITEGIYISRIDGDITTYDMRTRVPNMGDYMDNLTMHSTEHMFATYIRNSSIGKNVIYFGPMGCQTGFYLIVRDSVSAKKVLDILKQCLVMVVEYEGGVFGASEKECGNYRNLDLNLAKKICAPYYMVLENINEIITYDNVKQGEIK